MIGGGYATPDFRRGGMEHAETSAVEIPLLEMQEIAAKKLDVKISVISRYCLRLLSEHSSTELYPFIFVSQFLGHMDHTYTYGSSYFIILSSIALI